MAEIRGRYSLYSFLHVTYALTGENRNARMIFDTTQPEIRLFAKNSPTVPRYGVLPILENVFTIKRARLVSRGAPGLLAAPGALAAGFWINAIKTEDEVKKILDSVYMDFTQWNEWEDVNVALKPYKNIQRAESPAVTSIELGQTDIDFTCDDFNIQDDFVGQGVQAMLELDVETAGLLDSDTRSIF